MIYFLKSREGFIKIGTSMNVSSRINSLQTSNPTELKVKAILDGSYKTEKGLHELFNHIRYRGEWFKYNDEMRYYLKAIRENPEENNIYTLYKKSQQLRISDKAKRLSKNGNKKLLNKINKITCGV